MSVKAPAASTASAFGALNRFRSRYGVASRSCVFVVVVVGGDGREGREEEEIELVN